MPSFRWDFKPRLCPLHSSSCNNLLLLLGRKVGELWNVNPLDEIKKSLEIVVGSYCVYIDLACHFLHKSICIFSHYFAYNGFWSILQRRHINATLFFNACKVLWKRSGSESNVLLLIHAHGRDTHYEPLIVSYHGLNVDWKLHLWPRYSGWDFKLRLHIQSLALCRTVRIQKIVNWKTSVPSENMAWFTAPKEECLFLPSLLKS